MLILVVNILSFFFKKKKSFFSRNLFFAITSSNSECELHIEALVARGQLLDKFSCPLPCPSVSTLVGKVRCPTAVEACPTSKVVGPTEFDDGPGPII